MNNNFQMLIQMLNNSNPQQMLQNMIQRNPQANAIINQARQSGMSMQEYVTNLAKQRNIDINPIINALKQRGVKF